MWHTFNFFLKSFLSNSEIVFIDLCKYKKITIYKFYQFQGHTKKKLCIKISQKFIELYNLLYEF